MAKYRFFCWIDAEIWIAGREEKKSRICPIVIVRPKIDLQAPVFIRSIFGITDDEFMNHFPATIGFIRIARVSLEIILPAACRSPYP